MIIIVINCRRWKVQRRRFERQPLTTANRVFCRRAIELMLKYICSFYPFTRERQNGGTIGGVLNKVLYEEVPPRGPTPHLLYTMFDRQGTPLICLVCSFYRPKWQISVPTLNILQLVKLGSRPFMIHLTPEKGTPFREEPRRIGHCREYLPAFFLTQPIMAS